MLTNKIIYFLNIYPLFSISKKYDPMLSETYKAIQEEENDMQDVSPIAPKVFTPPRHQQPQPKVSSHDDHSRAVKVFAIKYIKKQLEQAANANNYQAQKINLLKWFFFCFLLDFSFWYVALGSKNGFL